MAPGVLAGRYELTAPLGRGGMGQVWEGADRQLGRRVAIKLLTDEHLAGRADPGELVRRFAREASITAGLQHPGVPAVHDAGSYDGGLYLVMELIEGYTLGDLIAEEGALPVPWAAAIGAQVCAVLAVAHDRGLVHRDLKPQNLMLTRDGMAKVLDFGVATVLDAAGVPRITRTGETVGTPAYMAPEQLRGERAIPHSDLYALGCVLYEMLAGRPVFEAASPHTLNYLHLEQPPAPLGRADMPPQLEWLVRRLLGKEPLQRPSGAREVFDGLLPFTAGAGPLAGIVPAGVASGGIHLYARALVRLTAPPPGHPAGHPSARPDLSHAAAFPAPADSPPPAAAASAQHFAALPTPASFAQQRVAFPVSADVAQDPGTQPAPSASGGHAAAHPMQPVSAPSVAAGPSGPSWPHASAPVPSHGAGWKLRHSLWILPTLSFGFTPWAAFLYIGLRHRHRWWIVTAAVYAVLTAVLLTLLIVLPENSLTGGLYLMAMTFAPIIHAVIVNPARLRTLARSS
ncbi:serine/threonine-protein kinase [Actinomadura rubrisoli]|uniref:non-specific serine/threonine protein kinase n=1 Tax=Actinomadura rubrisoli TaxID=2530368 RepID=A0A4R5BN73_9ACTN|nr:serine/threonine-protein kinase [Actinomadura rubrisoli]TDD86826.1 serine/threonine protein kinase [Actinomadura rubrisoli]